MIDKGLYTTITLVMPIPTTCVIVFAGNEVLLCKRQIEPNEGYWSTPGGHIELGETPVATAQRELKEETGLDIGITQFHELRTVTYFHPGRQDIAVVFWTELEWVEGVTLNDEASEYGWFDVHQLPGAMLEQTREIVKEAWEKRNGNRF